MPPIITEYPQFFTATNLEWKRLLKPDKYKDIIIGRMRFLVENKRVKIFSFSIMENHIHLIWKITSIKFVVGDGNALIHAQNQQWPQKHFCR